MDLSVRGRFFRSISSVDFLTATGLTCLFTYANFLTSVDLLTVTGLGFRQKIILCASKGHCCHEWAHQIPFTSRKRSLGQGNIFRSVCQSFCLQGCMSSWVCAWQLGEAYLPGGTCGRGACMVGGAYVQDR